MVVATSKEFSATLFDYLIVGTGPAGLTLASRLAEDKDVVVGILEAGEYTSNEPIVDIPGMAGQSLGHPVLDWGYKTVPQAAANNRRISQARGKAIGGSTAINFMVNDRASAEEYNAIESLGNPGWNWKEFLKYMKKSETYTPPTNDIVEQYWTGYTHEFHGHDGPLHKSFPAWYNVLHKPFLESLVKHGASVSTEAGGGVNSGASTSAFSVDPSKMKRSYAATAHYEPNIDKKNFVIITGAHATRVLLEPGADGEVTAMGVEFVKDGETVMAKASREVILAAGSYQTPQLLELSGIGKHDVLEEHGIAQVVDLPGVGENLQDHCYVPFAFGVSKDIETYECLQDPQRLAQEVRLYAEEKRGMLSSVMSAFGFLPLDVVTEAADLLRLQYAFGDDTSMLSNPTYAKQYPYLRKWFAHPEQVQLEVIQMPGLYPWGSLKPAEGAHYGTLMFVNLHPLSRGSVHITSADPLATPAIDPAYFQNPIDLDVLVVATRFARRFVKKEPFYHEGMKLFDPSEEVLEDDEALRRWCRDTVQPIFHPLGSAAMLPRSDGGVVDPELRVYGTKNLRVVDASIIPMQLSCHPQATVYAIAEKAANIIKAAWVL
ncbi:GMC oxidoreductase [Dentipellis sp. KUC8613]|nr:GMC oxidoreductase [Dentipellis sp. KUC8613]